MSQVVYKTANVTSSQSSSLSLICKISVMNFPTWSSLLYSLQTDVCKTDCKTQGSAEKDILEQDLHMLLLLPEKTYHRRWLQWLLSLKAKTLSYSNNCSLRKSVKFCSRRKVVAWRTSLLTASCNIFLW